MDETGIRSEDEPEAEAARRSAPHAAPAPDAPSGDPEPAASRSRWRDLTTRVLSALVLLPLGLLCIWAGGWALLIVVAAAAVFVCREWLAMCGWAGDATARVWMPAIVVASAALAGTGAPGAGLAVIAAGTLAAVLLAGRHGVPRRRFDLALGIPYVGLAAVAVPWLRADPLVGWPNTLFALAVVWGSDIGAYMVGRLIGGPRLAPLISPGKTWSGALGGLISAAAAALLVDACFSSDHSSSLALERGIALGIVSQAGDLLESALKRRFGVKDSGHLIPGHGGLLDRLDAVLAVAPVAALLAYHAGRGVVLWR